MTFSKVERVQDLAHLVGIAIAAAEVSEVADRFESLMRELESLQHLDLANIQPVPIFPEEEGLHG